MRKENGLPYGITQSPQFNFQKSRNTNSFSTNSFAITMNVSPPPFFNAPMPIQSPLQFATQDCSKIKDQDTSTLTPARGKAGHTADITEIVMSLIPSLKDKAKTTTSSLAQEKENLFNLNNENIFGANLDMTGKTHTKEDAVIDEDDKSELAVRQNEIHTEISGISNKAKYSARPSQPVLFSSKIS